jgi:hypothetical protein
MQNLQLVAILRASSYANTGGIIEAYMYSRLKSERGRKLLRQLEYLIEHNLGIFKCTVTKLTGSWPMEGLFKESTSDTKHQVYRGTVHHGYTKLGHQLKNIHHEMYSMRSHNKSQKYQGKYASKKAIHKPLPAMQVILHVDDPT